MTGSTRSDARTPGTLAGIAPDTAWHVLTGEYPPSPGGVADYTAVLAAALARDGVAVHIWTVPARDPRHPSPGVTVHDGAGGFDPAGLGRLGAALDVFPAPRRLLVQYTPYAWGRRGMNLAFGRWLRGRRRAGDFIRTMVHEPFYPWRFPDRPTRWLLAAAQRRMIRDVLAASNEVDVAIPAWAACLRSHDVVPNRPMTWLPVPSTIPVVVDAAAVAALRARLAPRGEVVVGCFSTYGPLLAPLVRAALVPVARTAPNRVVLLIGRGARGFVASAMRGESRLVNRFVAADGLSAGDVSIHLQACDMMVLPYPDGVSGRRTTMMAALAHGRAVVTNLGALSESQWNEWDGVITVTNPSAIPVVVEALLADPIARREWGIRARSLYEARFTIARTVAALGGVRPGTESLGPD